MGLTYVATPSDSDAEPMAYSLSWSSFEPVCALIGELGTPDALALLTGRCLEGWVAAEADAQVAAVTAALETFTEADTEETAVRAHGLGAFLRDAITRRCILTAND